MNQQWILLLTLVSSGCGAVQNYKLLNSYERKLADSNPVDTTVTDVAAKTDTQARILSAFFGLDSDFPGLADKAVCEGAAGKDGMPIIFSREIDVRTMQAGDFKITTQSGKTGRILCVTLAPADDLGELRTVLVAGEYGSIDDPPVDVEIVGNLLSMDGTVNFKGARIRPTRLEEGPTLILAEVVPEQQRELGKKGTTLRWGGGTGCPVGTKEVVRVTWAGGVTKPGGDEVDEVERRLYQVTVENADGTQAKVTPFALGDLSDGDNNHHLCLDVAGTPKSVFFPAGHMRDPRGDLNPDTQLLITKP